MYDHFLCFQYSHLRWHLTLPETWCGAKWAFSCLDNKMHDFFLAVVSLVSFCHGVQYTVYHILKSFAQLVLETHKVVSDVGPCGALLLHDADPHAVLGGGHEVPVPHPLAQVGHVQVPHWAPVQSLSSLSNVPDWVGEQLRPDILMKKEIMYIELLRITERPPVITYIGITAEYLVCLTWFPSKHMGPNMTRKSNGRVKAILHVRVIWVRSWLMRLFT